MLARGSLAGARYAAAATANGAVLAGHGSRRGGLLIAYSVRRGADLSWTAATAAGAAGARYGGAAARSSWTLLRLVARGVAAVPSYIPSVAQVRHAVIRTALAFFLAGILLLAGLMGITGHHLAMALSAGPPAAQLLADGGKGLYLMDRAGELLFEFASPDGGIRTPIPLSEMSPFLINATVATEDAEFWEHSGINFKGLSRAAYENLAFWEYGGFFKGTGGSSLTQQLAKNLYVPPDRWINRDITRKLAEMIYAFQLDSAYSKEQILEHYLNVVYYGNQAYGVEAAATRYFGKPSRDLTLGEAALLAGLPKAPSEYDPRQDIDAARARQAWVLDRMVQQQYITEAEAEAARSEELKINTTAFPIQAPHFVMHVRDILPDLIGSEKVDGSLRVTTTLDLTLQDLAQATVREHSIKLEAEVGATNASLVALDPRTGQVLAMVGSPDYFDERINGEVNNALALNSPGSTIKPVVYLAAFLKGWNPSTQLDDRALPINDQGRVYVLSNADDKFRGKVTARRALANSLNPPAIQALQHAGLNDVIDLARRMGLSTLDGQYGLAFGVGGFDSNVLDMTYAYSVLANNGEQRGAVPRNPRAEGGRPLDPILVLKVEDSRGNVLYEAEPRTERIVQAAQAYMVTHILSDNSARLEMFGPGSPLELPGRPAAVKTGTTDDYTETWTVGYTPQLVTGVWVGNDDNTPLRRGSLSSRTAGSLWNAFMKEALWNQPVQQFTPPDGLSTVTVCTLTGQLPGPDCPSRATEIFPAGQEPRQVVPVRPAPVPAPRQTAAAPRPATAAQPLPPVIQPPAPSAPPRTTSQPSAPSAPPRTIQPPASPAPPRTAPVRPAP